MHPKVALLAENDGIARAVVCEQLDIADLPCEFVMTKHGYPVRYLNDVWSIFDQNAQPVLQFLAMLTSHDRILVVTSSPCQDLTRAGPLAGKLGFVGKQSTAFHCVYLLFVLLKALNQLHRTFFVFENAGSMLDLHKNYLVKLMGLHPAHIKLIDSGDWSFASRKRYWFTSSVGISRQQNSLAWNTKD